MRLCEVAQRILWPNMQSASTVTLQAQRKWRCLMGLAG